MKLFLWLLFSVPTQDCITDKTIKLAKAETQVQAVKALGGSLAIPISLAIPGSLFDIRTTTTPILPMSTFPKPVGDCFDIYAARFSRDAVLYKKAKMGEISLKAAKQLSKGD